MPRVYPLRRYDLPDIGDHVIHFTGRDGQTYEVPQEIRQLSPAERLSQILGEGRIRAFPAFGTGLRPISAFTESSRAAVLQLIREGRYAPWGVAFTKQFVFDQGGGPVLYVRGDEWDAAAQVLPDPLRARIVRFWPGAEWSDGDPLIFDAQVLSDSVAGRSEWTHEREWRVPNDFSFTWDDVAFLITPSVDWIDFEIEQYELAYGPQYAHLPDIPVVAIDAGGNVVADPSGIWAPHP